jgi:hypothetical protein
MLNKNRFFHILRFLHFSDKRNEPDETKVVTGCGKRDLFLIGSIQKKSKWFELKTYMLHKTCQCI